MSFFISDVWTFWFHFYAKQLTHHSGLVSQYPLKQIPHEFTFLLNSNLGNLEQIIKQFCVFVYWIWHLKNLSFSCENGKEKNLCSATVSFKLQIFRRNHTLSIKSYLISYIIWLHHLVQLSSGGLRHLRSYYSMTLFRLECCDTRRSSIAQTAYAKACSKMWCKIWLWSVLSLGWLEIFDVYVHALYRNRYSPEICSHVFLVKWLILFSEPKLC